MSDLETARGDEIVEFNGARWRIIGFVRHPAVILQKEGTDFEDVNRHVVIPTSEWANSWKVVATT